MNWLASIPLEPVETLNPGTPLALRAGVAEAAPSQSMEVDGETRQRITLMLPSGEYLAPPMRLMVRGDMVRVLGTQRAAFKGAPSLVTCERVNPDLPDEVSLIEVTGPPVLDVTSGLYVAATVTLWSGPAHVVSGVPATVDAAGEDAPLDRVTVTLPMAAPYRAGLSVDVTTSRTPGLVGATFKLSGEVLDSGASLRRVIGYRQGV